MMFGEEAKCPKCKRLVDIGDWVYFLVRAGKPCFMCADDKTKMGYMTYFFGDKLKNDIEKTYEAENKESETINPMAAKNLSKTLEKRTMVNYRVPSDKEWAQKTQQLEVTCPECHTEFPITQQNEWNGLCPDCQFRATEDYLSAQKYLEEEG